MRLLAGPVRIDLGRRMWEDGPDTRYFDYDDGPFADVLAAATADGWQPDAVVFFHPEYHLLPEGIEQAPVPLVFVVGDWHIGLSQVLAVRDLADVIVTDRAGVDVFRAWGCPEVHPWPIYSFEALSDPPAPDEGYDYDVSFIGSFNHLLHAERSRWLARLAQLSDRYRIGILTGLWGEDYRRVLRRSRIVFNHSVRGEMNLRAYEAPAAGALLAMEAGNREVADVLPPGEACWLYDDATFERELVQLLEDEPRRAAMAAAGRARIARESRYHHWQRLKALLADLPAPPPRHWHALPPAEQLLRRAWQAYPAHTPGALAAARTYLEAAERLAPADPLIQHALAVVEGQAVLAAGDSATLPRRAQPVLQRFKRLLASAPTTSLAWLNYGRLLVSTGDAQGAATAWQQALATLSRARPLSLEDVLLPLTVDHLKRRWEGAVAGGDAQAAKRVLEAQLTAWLGILGLMEGDPGAGHWLEQAAVLDPDHAQVWVDLGEWRAERHDVEGTIQAWQAALRCQPFLMPVRLRLLELLKQAGRGEQAAKLYRETARLIAACPSLAEHAAALERLRPL